MASNSQLQHRAGEINLAALQDTLTGMYYCRTLVGSVPLGPATVRGRLGAALVRVTRRTLFWLWPQLDSVHAAVIEFASKQISVTAQLLDRMIALDDQLHGLRASFRELQEQLAHDDSTLNASAEAWMETVKSRSRLQTLSDEIARIVRTTGP